MYSLIETCKAQEVDPREWLTDVLKRISAYNKDYNLDLADLLPHNWKARQCQPVSNRFQKKLELFGQISLVSKI